MTSYTLAKLVHVLTAVLAMGLVTAAAILARTVASSAIRSLLRVATAGLVMMIGSGLVLDHLVGGAYHAERWFRIGLGWTLAAGAALGYAQLAIARKPDPRRRVLVASWLALACIATVVVVMVRRP